MAQIRLIPSTYAVSNTSYLSVDNASNAYANTDSTNYATITNTNASTSSRYYYLRGFNFSDIPSNAIINSFTVKIKGYERGLATNTSYAPRLANGTSALANTTASSNFGTSTKTITIPTGALTWQQMVNYGSSFTIMVYVRRNNKNNTGYFYCYGAEILVDYTIPVYHSVSFNNTSSVSTSPSTTQSILEGDDLTIQFNTSNKNEIIVSDNNVDVSSQIVQGTNNCTYTISNIQADHTISITDATYYNLVASSSHDTATISPLTMKVYQGQSAVFTINGAVSDIILEDNGIDVTSSISNGTYTITNVSEVHTLVLMNRPRDYVKVNGIYKKVSKVLKKINGAWAEINKTTFDDFVSTNIVMYGGNISFDEIGNVETVGEIINININNNALLSGTYKLIYEGEHREPLDNVDKITEFTI